MTHKEDLKDYIADTKDAFATVRAKECKDEYYCCFGCKKTLKDRQKMRDHMKASDECRAKHDVFLQDIGIEKQTLNVEESRRMKELIRENEALREHCKEMEDSSVFSARIKSLEQELHTATKQIERMEEFWFLLPTVMKSDIVKYCEEWISRYEKLSQPHIPGAEVAKRRREFISILYQSPVLQMYLMPRYRELLNQHAPNGTHTTILCKYFPKLDYIPVREPSPRNNYLNMPPLPIYNDTEDKSMLEKIASMAQSAAPISNFAPAKKKPKTTSC